MKDKFVGIVYTLSLAAFLLQLLFPAAVFSFMPLFVSASVLNIAALPALSHYVSIAQTICKIE